MIVELGHFALILAFSVAVYQAIVPLIGAQCCHDRLMAVAPPSAMMQLILIAIAFAVLLHAFVVSDFSVAMVWANSHSAKPLLYKITGLWGNHEGSMMLWVLVLALFGGLVAVFGRNLPPGLKARVLSVQAMIAAAFLLFILLASNPFTRLQPAPIEGRGLNPVLQDPALAFHPPCLYVGYVGLSVTFSFAIAALIEGRVDAAFARYMRPWILTAFIFLTLGLAMGSWWAYYELGWGGFWFWDPVENAALMPWLATTALLHSALILEKRNALKIWTVLLAIIAFSLSLAGTFLVRSGVLTSVHAFAVDPDRGLFILAIMCVFIGGGFLLFAWRAPSLKAKAPFAPVSCEGALIVNNLVLGSSAASVFIGTLYPLAAEAITGERISVGAPYFNLTFIPLILPLLLLVPIGPMLPWKTARIWPTIRSLWVAGLVAFTAGIVAFAIAHGHSVMAPLGVALGLWLLAGTFQGLASKTALFSAGPRGAVGRVLQLPRAMIGMTLAHAGLGVIVLGIVAATAWRQEMRIVMAPGETVRFAGLSITFKELAHENAANYYDTAGHFRIVAGRREFDELTASRRLYKPGRRITSEVGIHAFWTGNLYVAMGQSEGEDGHLVRFYFHPLAGFIWVGALIMALGGMISLTDRRYRIGTWPHVRRVGAVTGLVAVMAVTMTVLSVPTMAYEAGERLTDPTVESRARSIEARLRCPVCQAQSIADSNAPLAKTLRGIVRERLTAGDSDDQVFAFMSARYGDFVLLQPPFKSRYYILWLSPFVIFSVGGIVVARWMTRAARPSQADAPSVSGGHRRPETLPDNENSIGRGRINGRHGLNADYDG
ncbi:MAG: heme lyase CcmF/NrfE family subunit [Hyphomicrobiales bacterium]